MTVYYYPTENQDAELKRFRAGELDITEDIPQKQIAWVRGELSGFRAHRSVPRQLLFRLQRDEAAVQGQAEVCVRRWRWRSIGDIIAEQVSGAGEMPSYGWVPARDGLLRSDRAEWAEWTQAEREAEAQRLYAEAGYSERQAVQGRPDVQHEREPQTHFGGDRGDVEAGARRRDVADQPGMESISRYPQPP